MLQYIKQTFYYNIYPNSHKYIKMQIIHYLYRTLEQTAVSLYILGIGIETLKPIYLISI